MTPRTSKKVRRQLADSFDAFVFVTPEYNHGPSGALKNAIDFLYREWNNKAAAFVSYGGASGTRAVEQLRLVMGELQVADVRAQVALSLATDFQNFATFMPAPRNALLVGTMLDQLISWAVALQTVRGGERARPVHSPNRSEKRPIRQSGSRARAIARSPPRRHAAAGRARHVSSRLNRCGARRRSVRRQEFDLISFGGGIVGPLNERLRLEFARQNSHVQFLDVFAPVAIKQINLALEGPDKPLQYVADFHVAEDGLDYVMKAMILHPGGGAH
jgi:NAD(P)H-dependent FMN reductase